MSNTPTPTTISTQELVPVYVWQLPVRVTHWLIAFSIAILAFTGFYIGNPFIDVSGEARYHFVMGTMRTIHSYTAIVFTLSVLSRIWWMFAGNKWSGWRQLVPIEKRRRTGMIETLKFYLLIRQHPPNYVGHNPLAGFTYIFVFLLYLVMICTGLGLYSVSAHVDSPMRVFGVFLTLVGGPQSARFIHHVGMWLLIAFFAHHIWSAITVSRSERTGLMDSIFSGWKFLRPKDLQTK